MKYYLVENLLTERPDDYMAQVVAEGVLGRAELVGRILAKSPDLTKETVEKVLSAAEAACQSAVEQGWNLNLPLFRTSISIAGVFDGADDAFDASRHKVAVNASRGALLKAAQEKIALEKTATVVPQPAILEVRDANSGAINSQIMRGGVVELVGTNIKIAGNDPKCGLWFVCGGQEVKAQVVAQNKPSSVMAVVPALPEGAKECEVRVVTQYSNGSRPLRKPRSCVYDRPLLVK